MSSRLNIFSLCGLLNDKFWFRIITITECYNSIQATEALANYVETEISFHVRPTQKVIQGTKQNNNTPRKSCFMVILLEYLREFKNLNNMLISLNIL